MKRIFASLLCGAAMCATVLPVNAMTATINGREHNQQFRIRQGMKSGELTRQETKRLETEEARIRANESRAKRDGKLSPAERERLEKELDKASHDIYQQKHD
jgi:hypothetical protein